MSDVATFARFAQTVALDRLSQDHSRLALVFYGGLVGCVDLFWIVAAAFHLFQPFVGVVLHQLKQLWILTEEVFADVGARHTDVLLVLAVDHFGHALCQ